MAHTEIQAALKSLEVVVQSALTLLAKLHDTLAEIQRESVTTEATPNQIESKPSIEPSEVLPLSKNSAALVRAHATKISLLIINEPYTPSAISQIVRDLVGGPIPGIVAAVQACDSDTHTQFFRKELAWASLKILDELRTLLAKIPLNGKVVPQEQRDITRTGERGSITTTAVLWAACDDLTKLVDAGVGKFLVGKVEQWKETLEDVAEEMKEWGEEEPDDDNDDDEEDASSEQNGLSRSTGSLDAAQTLIDDFMNSHKTIPRLDPENIRPRLDSSVKRLRLVVILYQAILKRRLKKLPSLPSPSNFERAGVPKRLDEILAVLKELPDYFGDLQLAFYELNSEGIDQQIGRAFTTACKVSEMVGENWNAEKDEFTEWTARFQQQIKPA